MKKSLLSTVVILGLGAYGALAQMYTPAASTLPAGTVGQAYVGQTISFIVPAVSTISGSVVASALPAQFQSFAGAISGQSFPFNVTSTTLALEGLPVGITATCSASPCTFAAGASGTLTLVGTPTASGTFPINITSLTSGSADLSAFVNGLPFNPGVPSTLAIPQPVPGALDEEGYAMSVAAPSSIEESNSVFALSIYPNPTEGLATLDVNSSVAGTANVEIYNVAGALVSSRSEAIRIGANRVSLDMQALPTGVYMVKTLINGSQALVRVQKG